MEKSTLLYDYLHFNAVKLMETYFLHLVDVKINIF